MTASLTLPKFIAYFAGLAVYSVPTVSDGPIVHRQVDGLETKGDTSKQRTWAVPSQVVSKMRSWLRRLPKLTIWKATFEWRRNGSCYCRCLYMNRVQNCVQLIWSIPGVKMFYV